MMFLLERGGGGGGGLIPQGLAHAGPAPIVCAGWVAVCSGSKVQPLHGAAAGDLKPQLLFGLQVHCINVVRRLLTLPLRRRLPDFYIVGAWRLMPIQCTFIPQQAQRGSQSLPGDWQPGPSGLG